MAVSPTLVELEGASQPLGSLQQRLARERGEVPIIPGERLRGFLAKPDGNGPFPAAKDCVRKVAQWGSAGAPIELVTYPGAYHEFNLPDLEPGRMIFDHWLEYNAEAANDANRRIRELLAQTLGR